MAFVPIPQTAYCEIRFTSGTNKAENTLWYIYPGSPPSAASLLNLAASIGNGVAEKIRQCMTLNTQMREVYCRDMSAQTANQATALFAPGTSGVRGGGAVAGNEAGSIVRRTGLTGRSQHGAIRVGEFAESDVDGNTLGNFLMGLLNNVAIEMLVSYVSGNYRPALGSKHTGTARLLQAAGTLDSNVDSQKTRLNGHGT